MTLEEGGYQCEVVDTGELGLDLSALVFAVPGPNGEGERTMSVTVLPDQGALEYCDLVQGWMVLGPATPDAARALAEANAVSPIGHIAIQDGEMHHRHIWPLPVGLHVTTEVLEEWLSLFLFSADTVLGQVDLSRAT
jgi:hypothetical protein